MDIIDIEENSKIGDRYRVVFSPRLDMIGSGSFQFSENSIRQILESVDALNFEWKIIKISFPIVNGVKSVEVIMERVLLIHQAGQALTVLIAGLAGALAFAFLIISVEKIADDVTSSPGFSFAAIGILALIAGAGIILLKK